MYVCVCRRPKSARSGGKVAKIDLTNPPAPSSAGFEARIHPQKQGLCLEIWSSQMHLLVIDLVLWSEAQSTQRNMDL